MDFYREATLRPRVRGERSVVGDGDGADDGQSEAVVVVTAGAVEWLEGVEEAVGLLDGYVYIKYSEALCSNCAAQLDSRQGQDTGDEHKDHR